MFKKQNTNKIFQENIQNTTRFNIFQLQYEWLEL